MIEETAGTQDGGEGTVAALEALLEQPAFAEAKAGKPEGQAAGGSDSQKDKGGAMAEEPPDQGAESEEDEGDGPGEDQVTEEEDESEGDPEAVIAAPKSWPAEMREQFAQLPPDLQQVIADRETERDAAFNRQVNEAAQ